ncbi:MAG: TIGR02266 family protein, partial [Nitrospirae bacterium]|nr:TIGR02266 family protein [Nitrospirota bacterium]
MIKKRAHHRIPFNKPVKLTFEHLGSFITQYSSNISENGMFIITERPYPLGTRFQFEFTLKRDHELIAGEAEVRWIKEKVSNNGVEERGMGVRFITLRPGSRELI